MAVPARAGAGVGDSNRCLAPQQQCPGASGPSSVNSPALALSEHDRWVTELSRRAMGYQDTIRLLVRDVTARLGAHATQRRGSPGLLMAGASGCGKTHLARAIVETSPITAVYFNCGDLFHADEGEAERRLLSLFAVGQGAKIVVLDDLEAVAARNVSPANVIEYRLRSLLWLCLEQACELQFPLIVIGITSTPSSLDPCFTRSGCLDQVYSLVMTESQQRKAVLAFMTKDLTVDETEATLAYVAGKTHGFYPSDLRLLVFTAAQAAILEALKNGTETAVLYQRHFDAALSDASPANLNEFRTSVPSASFDSLFGIGDTIEKIKKTVIQPFHHPSALKKLGFRPSRGVLVHGPAGVGKSQLCYAIARELGVNFVSVQATQVRSKVVGESERNIARLFETARRSAPCILFIDQIEVLGAKRGTSLSSENTGDRIVTSFLTEMDGVLTKTTLTGRIDVFVLAATNRIDMIDPALLRPGRLDQHVALCAPDGHQRFEILNGLIGGMPHSIPATDLQMLAEAMHGYSGADIESALREAALLALRQDIDAREITLEHLRQAMSVVMPSLLQ